MTKMARPSKKPTRPSASATRPATREGADGDRLGMRRGMSTERGAGAAMAGGAPLRRACEGACEETVRSKADAGAEGPVPAKDTDLVAPRFKSSERLEQALDDERYVSQGSYGDHVVRLQQAMMDIGYPLENYGADGAFGSETRRAISQFQSDFGLGVDGIVGPKTMGALDDIFSAERPAAGNGGDEEQGGVIDGENPSGPTYPPGERSIEQMLAAGELPAEYASADDTLLQTDLKKPPKKLKIPPAIEKVEVDLSKQTMTVEWGGGRVTGPYAICSGRGCPNTKGNPCVNPKASDRDTYCTPVGTFSNLRLGGKGYTNSHGQAMAWYVAFVTVRGIGIHHSDSVLKVPSSHGCVRTLMSIAKMIHNNVTTSSVVVVKGKAATKAWKTTSKKVIKEFAGCPGKKG